MRRSTNLAGFSDWLDGYVARRFDQQSKLGSYLDPIADKVLLGCVVGALGFQVTFTRQAMLPPDSSCCAGSRPTLVNLDAALLCCDAPWDENFTERRNNGSWLSKVPPAKTEKPWHIRRVVFRTAGDSAAAAGRSDLGPRRTPHCWQLRRASQGARLAVAGRGGILSTRRHRTCGSAVIGESQLLSGNPPLIMKVPV